MLTVNIFPALLLLISGFVATGISRKKNMWTWICVYWWVLAIKNCCDFLQ